MSTIDEESVLSSDETRALLEAMQANQSARIESLQLGAPDRPLRDALARADAAAAHLSVAVRKVFVRVLSSIVRTPTNQVEVRSFGPVASTLRMGACIAPLCAGDGSFAGFVGLGPSLTAFVLERRLGVPEENITAGESGAALSRMDRRLLRPIVESVVESLSMALFAERAVVVPGALLAHPGELEQRAPAEPFLTLVVRVVRADDQEDEILVGLSAETARRILGPIPGAAASPGKDAASPVASFVPEIDVEAQAILGKTRSTVGHVLALEVGDVIRLETIPGDPLVLRIGDADVLRGMPVVHHGNLALEITTH